MIHGGRAWALPDFSTAGYRLGAVAPASGLPCRHARIAGAGDITDELQRALDEVGAAGGGTVTIPAGRFTLSRSVAVAHDDVAIEGAGSGRTVVRIPAWYRARHDFHEGVLTLGRRIGAWGKGWVDRGATLADVNSPVRAGDTQLVVRDASALRIGAWVVVTQYHWEAFSQLHSGGAWPWTAGFAETGAGREGSFAYLRQVLAIDGARVTLDAPIPWRLDPRDNPVRLRDAERPAWIRMRRNVGVSGLALEFDDNHNGSDDRPVGTGVYFEGVRDGWIRDVQVRNFPRFGVFVDHSARVSVLDTVIERAQDVGSGGYGYGVFLAASQHVLVRDVHVADTRHGFSLRSGLGSLIAITRSSSAASRLGDDTHFGLTHAVLWDAHRLRDAGLQGLYRGRWSDGAHETLGSGVYWNVHGDGGELALNPAATGWAIVAGATGVVVVDAGTERMAARYGMQLGRAAGDPGRGSRDGNVLYEGIGREGLAPASLYEAQLQQRLGPDALRIASGASAAACVPVPQTAPRGPPAAGPAPPAAPAREAPASRGPRPRARAAAPATVPATR